MDGPANLPPAAGAIGGPPTITITLKPDLSIGLSAPLDNTAICFMMLELAKLAITMHAVERIKISEQKVQGASATDVAALSAAERFRRMGS